MNWDTINTITQLVSALAVIFSLIYLARQVRQGTKDLRTTIQDSSFHSLMEWNYYIISDKDLAWIFQQGCKDFDSLEEKERARYMHLMYNYFKQFENIYLHYCEKIIGDDVWESNKKMLNAYILTQGVQNYWQKRKPIFNPKFQNFIDSIKETDILPGHVISEKSASNNMTNK